MSRVTATSRRSPRSSALWPCALLSLATVATVSLSQLVLAGDSSTVVRSAPEPKSIAKPAADSPAHRLASVLADAKQEEVPPPAVSHPAPLLIDEGVPPPDFNFGGCPTCGGARCVPGQKPCTGCCDAETRYGRFFCGIYEAICCPDPCYDPCWTPVADASFFTPAARPVNQQRLRYDANLNVLLPDRAEYYWARADGMGQGPAPTPPYYGERSVNIHEITWYTEIAKDRFSMFVEMPYRSTFPEDAPHEAGFGDMNIGTKTLLFDCELMQVTLQSRTFIPMGSAGSGLGNGHMTLEPSLIVSLNLGPDTYLQTQIAEWIPLGGDSTYQGAILHYHGSLNHTLWRFNPQVPLVGTLEFNGYSFQDGAYTDPYVPGPQSANNDSYFSLGPGLRIVVCDKVDFGVGTAFALTDPHWGEQVCRTEFRYRF